MSLRSTRLFGIAATGALLAGAAQAQTTIASEDFDSYTLPVDVHAGAGGSCWFQPWYALGGPFGTDPTSTVVSPGLGGTAQAALTLRSNEGSFRLPKTGPFSDTIAPGFQFGGDGSTIYISFDCQRNPGSTDQYGGLSLQEQFVGEKLFLGSPFASFDWGIAGSAVAGTDIDTETHLVYRIDYQAGDELCSLWINPATPLPDPLVTAPDLQTVVGDHTWNEIRIQSGEPSDGTNTGYLFDNISIECLACDPPMLAGDIASLSLGAGGTQNLTLAAGCESEGLLYIMLGSLTGDTGFPFGAFHVPLDIDAYFTYTLTSPGAPPIGNGVNLLDGDGKSGATIDIPAGTNPALAGFSFYHAYVLFDLLSIDPIVDVSNAVSLDLNL